MSWIRTYSGKKFYPLEPRLEDICIEDIAHALSNQCRFTGHLKEFFSVGQHSLLVASIVAPKLKLTALLHDAGEAFIGDMSRPLKHTVAMDDYRAAEEVLARMISLKFGTIYPLPREVKRADDIALVTEAHHLMPMGLEGWEYPDPMPEPLPKNYEFVGTGLSPETAKYHFLRAYNEFRAFGVPASLSATTSVAAQL